MKKEQDLKRFIKKYKGNFFQVIINEKARKVIVKLLERSLIDGRFIPTNNSSISAMATCQEGDSWDERFGVYLAILKCLQKQRNQIEKGLRARINWIAERYNKYRAFTPNYIEKIEYALTKNEERQQTLRKAVK